MRRTLIAIMGVTASGKTAVAEGVAASLGAEVVCADARQLFRELVLGTGKPTRDELAALPHHLFDLHELGEQPTAGRWALAAADVCESCFARGVVPVLVGGSGLYLNALREGLHPEPPKDASVRAALESECAALGVAAMHARLRSLDPGSADRLASRDRQRILRALEVVQVGGRSLAWWRELPREAPLAADWRAYELVCESARLSERIEHRSHSMWGSGLLEETRALVELGHEASLRRLAAIGYDEALERLAGSMGAEEAERRMNERTRQLAKRQRTWFRHQTLAEPIPIDPGVSEVMARVLAGVLGPG